MLQQIMGEYELFRKRHASPSTMYTLIHLHSGKRKSLTTSSKSSNLEGRNLWSWSCSKLGCLCLSSSSSGSSRLVASLALEIASRSGVTVETGALTATSLLRTSSSTPCVSARPVVATVEATGCARSWSSLFDINCFASNRMWIVRHGRSIRGWILKLDKCTLL